MKHPERQIHTAIVSALRMGLPGETWSAIVGFEGLYEVSSLGRIRSLDKLIHQNSRWGRQCRRHFGRELRTKPIKDGYLGVCLWKDGAPYYRHVAHLVAESFIGPRPDGHDVCHNDGCRTNNSAGNLRYDTRRGNHADREKHGTLLRGSQCPAAKLTEEHVRIIRAAAEEDYDPRRLAIEFGCKPHAIRAVRARRSWRHVA